MFLHTTNTAEGLDLEQACCWKSSMDWQGCSGVTLLHLMAGCGLPFPRLGEMYLPNLHIHKCQRWVCWCQMGWQGFSWLFCSFSFPRNRCRLPASLFLHSCSTAQFQHQGPTYNILPLVWMLSCYITHSAFLRGPSACQVVSNHIFNTTQPRGTSGEEQVSSSIQRGWAWKAPL